MRQSDSIFFFASASIALIMAASQSVQVISPPVPTTQMGIGLFKAVEIGRDFLDNVNLTTGKVLSTSLEVREPNDYWSVAYSLEKPDTQEPSLLWVIRFEQAARPGHYFEVWVNQGGRVLGGSQCK